jgi:hypothetical protein
MMMAKLGDDLVIRLESGQVVIETGYRTKSGQ